MRALAVGASPRNCQAGWQTIVGEVFGDGLATFAEPLPPSRDPRPGRGIAVVEGALDHIGGTGRKVAGLPFVHPGAEINGRPAFRDGEKAVADIVEAGQVGVGDVGGHHEAAKGTDQRLIVG